MKRNDQSAGPHGALTRVAHAMLTRRYLPVAFAILAVVLALPSLGVGWVMDDHFHRIAMLGSSSSRVPSGSPADIFRFLDGDPERTRRFMDLGVLPWWTFPQIEAAFWRPITTLTHRLDYRLWPRSPALMHVQSLLWFGALVAAVTLLYRRFMGFTWVAGIAALLYAIDDAHATPVSFLANRNALLAAFLGVLALYAHDRRRRDGRRIGGVVGPVLFAASLLSAESGIATCAYLAAHALFVDRGTWRQRSTALIPYAVVVFVWRIAWSHQGYGVSGMGLYIDPIGEPLRYAAMLLNRAPVLLLGQWALPPSDITMMLTAKGTTLLCLIAWVFLVALAVVLVPLLRRDRLARFWATGMVLSVAPICATFPHDRLLLFVGIGAMGLLAQFFGVAFGEPGWRPRNLPWRAAAVSLAYVFVWIHLMIAPLVLPFRAAFPAGPTKWAEKMHARIPLDRSVERQDVVIINAPSSIHAAWSAIDRELSGHPVPRHTRILAPAFPSVVIRRTDARTLVIRPGRGYLAWKFDRLFRSEDRPMSLGERVELTGMTVEVTELTDDGWPAEASFRFAVPLEDPSLRWLHWDDGVLVPFTPPPVGESVELRPAKPAFFP